ncbi:TPA: hypothetical protein ACH3X3_000470 [Trebouxia sp. C0006]
MDSCCMHLCILRSPAMTVSCRSIRINNSEHLYDARTIYDILKQMSQSLQSMSHADQPPCCHTGQLASYRVTESKYFIFAASCNTTVNVRYVCSLNGVCLL